MGMQSIHCMFWVIYAVYRLHVCEKMQFISFLTFSISCFTDSISERETIKNHYFYDDGY